MSELIWAEVCCEVPAELVDAVAEFLVEVTGAGVSIDNRAVDTFSLETVEDSAVKTVKGYLVADREMPDKLSQIDAFLAKQAFPGFIFHPPEVHYLRQEDWANNWKEHFKPSRIGSRLVIKPTWETYAAQHGDVVIELDPGMAFGTGTHATTRLCLEVMERIFFGDYHYPFEKSDSTPRAVLDVGTGSGVLAIAAVKMGNAQVVGIDIDPSAVAVANDNLAQNGVAESAHISTEPLEQVVGTFDIVVANILAEELVRLSAHLVGKLKEGGILILSGILTEKEELVLSGFAPYGLILVETTRQAEWSCIVYSHGSR